MLDRSSSLPLSSRIRQQYFLASTPSELLHFLSREPIEFAFDLRWIGVRILLRLAAPPQTLFQKLFPTRRYIDFPKLGSITCDE